MKIKYYLLAGISMLFLAASCGESLEDTYKDYAGDGEIRYLGRCTELTVRPGWKRLIVNWVNSDDPMVDKIKLTWTANKVTQEVLLPKGTTEYSIPDLSNESYEIAICSVDKDGNQSLSNQTYERPYTEDHEAVMAFTRVVSKHFFLHDRLILFFLGWENNVDEAYITYTNKKGESGKLELTENLVNGLFFMMPDEVDTTKPVQLYRNGKIPGCEDEIYIQPVELGSDKTFNADFRQEMKRQYGYDNNIPTGWINTVEELSLDRYCTDFTDLLNFPNLKKLKLGSHRYIRPEMVDDAERSQATVSDAEASDFVLKVMHQLTGLTVERYTKQYADLQPASYIKEMGVPTVPQYDFLDLSKLKFTSVPQDGDGYNSHLEYLTDGKQNSSWSPYPYTSSMNYTLELDLKEVKTLHGLKLVQTYFDEYNEDRRVLCPSVIKVQVSQNGLDWESAAYLENLEIGNSTGETNIIPFVEDGRKGRYVRVVLPTIMYTTYFSASIAEIGLY